MSGEPTDGEMVEALKAVAHPLRLRILDALRTGEMNVGEIEAETAIQQPALSQQLAVLRKAGLVSTRKHAKLVFYKLVEGEFDALARLLEGFAGAKRGQARTRRNAAPGAANFARLS